MPSWLVLFDEASGYVGEVRVTRNRWWSQVNSQLGTEDHSPTTLKKLNSANNHVNLEVYPSPVEPSDETLGLANNCSPVRGPEPEHSVRMSPDP